ncbi:toxin-antitoxin system YwqK family antitoxin [Aquimarina agarivorans]|uniref:toxin-antitoxin system YwqK family antitoxin n=1 Tax=Aquimarina agarivorans TaxID=980584 RepID=UPI000248F2EB|nr:hypothetical protein [Aquimarina agarivorans]
MFNFSQLKYFMLVGLLLACKSKPNELTINDTNLALVNGLMLYKDKPYSGILISKIDTLITYKSTYVEGKKDGKEEKFFFNGDLAASKFYANGKKQGIHRSWWNKKQLKSEYQFNKKGKYHGVVREWYGNGQLLKEYHYVNGEEVGTQKMWDPKGRIIANYSVIDGERYGLVEYKKCKPVTNVE